MANFEELQELDGEQHGDGATLESVDVVIVGAGLSGVGAAYRLQEKLPDLSYAVLEARSDLGGTWDLFRYPGIRSDSDMYTLGYSFRPWRSPHSIADGSSVLGYIRDTARENGIDKKIRYNNKIVEADFDTAAARWTLTVEDPRTGRRRQMTCRFLYSCAGYYDYDNPHTPEFPGLAEFEGRVVHPQFWPEGLDYSGKRVVVIGSGATAVTIVPSMLKGDGAAAHVTMLQRTPTWISPVSRTDKHADRLKTVLPPNLAHKAIRTKNILIGTAIYQFCRRRPEQARKALSKVAIEMLGDPQLVADHFTPTYDPWDQRLCAIPSGDLFHAIKAGDAEVVTDHIDTFVPEGICLRSGRTLEADIVVTATGLKLRGFAGIEPSVDGQKVPLSDQFVWNGAMLTGVPNFAFCVGYTNASWTLRADLTHRLVCKVLTWMGDHDYATVQPRPDDGLDARPLMDLAAGYVQRSIASFPSQGHKTPWLVRQNYILDSVHTLRTDLAGTLLATRAAAPASPQQLGAERPSGVPA